MGPSSVRGATRLTLSLRAPVTSNTLELMEVSTKRTPPMVTVDEPSMKPLPRR